MSILSNVLLPSQRSVRQDRRWYWFEEARQCWRAIGLRPFVNINRGINEMQFPLRARRGDIEQAALLFEVVKLILKPVRRKPTISHPDQEHVVPLQTFRRVDRRERDESGAAPRRVFLDGFSRVKRNIVKQLRRCLVTLRDYLQVFEVAATALHVVVLALQERTVETQHRR